MNAKQITALVTAEAEPYCAMVGCRVWDVKFLREAGEWYLRVFIDTVPPGSVTIDMCETVNRALDRRLDELDPIEQSYYLEVSSPGLDRELSRDSDFDEFAGSDVDVRLYKPNEAGEKAFTAKLLRREPEAIVLERNGNEYPVPRAAISQVRIHFDF